MRKVKIGKIDMFGFNGRDNHPEKRHEGMVGIVLNSYWENGSCDDSTGLGVSKQTLLEFARKLARSEGERGDEYEVLSVYIQETDEIVCLVDFETEPFLEPCHCDLNPKVCPRHKEDL
jgi:hypothetical protein